VSWRDFEAWQWALALMGAFFVGISKTGIAGLGMLFVVLFAQIMPAKQATGVVLPLLCFGDVVAVSAYRQHASWPHLWRLFPWAALGIVGGALAMGHLDNGQVKLLIGLIVVGLVVMHLYRRVRGGREAEHGTWFAPAIGVLAGFTTLVANAAGPLMAVYLLAMRLPKMEYVGTAAVFFLLINLFKVPFMIWLGLITPPSFTLNLILLPAVLVGAFVGKKILTRINQRWFENLALVLATLAGLKLLFF
jgi:uncharacterized membrane protein YfcA